MDSFLLFDHTRMSECLWIRKITIRLYLGIGSIRWLLYHINV